MNSVVSTSATAVFDEQRANEFAERIAGTLDAGAVAVMLSIGHRTGLLDRMAGMPPATSAEIADACDLNERYVREWLASMVTGGIVEYRPQGKAYQLPAEHAASITRQGSLGNLAVYSQHIALLGAVQDQILARFESGEGTRYGDYPCFHEIMAEDSGMTVLSQLFDTLLPLVEGLGERLEQGIDVLDAGCGRGRALTAMARRYPRSRFVGYDLCAEAIEYANRVVEREGLDNIRFEVRDLTDFDDRDCFDLITSFDAVHDQKDPGTLIGSYFRALRPGGHYLMQDIGGSAYLENNLEFPLASMLYAVSCCHCMPISLGQGGKGLGTMWGWETAEAMLIDAGFNSVERNTLPHDPTNVWFVSTKE
ncbi:methyltransferase domain-containing protein [Marinobacterium sp. D7]|uniref:class I SAM-dependent methyltransferase n=1 Tax=Marinobacterium ramblicola TaxID=2849041 RepID=UPI001C2DB1CB|nr:class I SAM-dependent methyltransferase [Marinobacterium ramblicola]MBV1789813.1 methyltransferase domain-containing protein [Marinobacterium ramblicola]